MDKVTLDLTHCYGIKRLKHTFDFTKSDNNAFAIYAPNGVMKSSLAETFLDAARNQKSKDRIFPDHKTQRSILDEAGKEIEGRRVLVVVPYDEHLGPNEQTSVLLVNSDLRKELANLLAPTNEAKATLLAGIRDLAKSKTNFENEIATAFTKDDDLFVALGRIRDEVQKQKDAVFSYVEYDKVFNEKVTTALGTKGLKDAVETYIKTYNELLDGSTFFKKGMFDYYNAGQIAESLAKNGFFDAKHTVHLKSQGKTLEINDQDELEAVISEEKERILTDKKLRASFETVAKQLQKNAELREFCRYLQSHDDILAQMNKPEKFKEDVLKSYLKVNEVAFLDLMTKHEKAQKRKDEIAEIARKERTQWEEVIAMFNERFIVPFELEAKNKIDCVLGDKVTPELGFTYRDGAERAKVNKSQLLEVLSNGERKALYILNVLFAVETRKKEALESLVVVDDLADSFDYQNKYAIIQYLKDISAGQLFKLIIMTHNFDFFRTVVGRFVGYGSNLMASKNEKDITLAQASGINNIFANVWKKAFFSDARKKIASICFLRNLVENTVGSADPDFIKLTSMLHWKDDTAELRIKDLDAIYNRICQDNKASADPEKRIHELIDEEGKKCLTADLGMNLDNKVVLSIATRLRAEKFMIDKIADAAFVSAIKKDQTSKLKEEFQRKFPGERPALAVLDRVALMTPENIHLNSFMYEPLIDMSDDHLRKLYQSASDLK